MTNKTTYLQTLTKKSMPRVTVETTPPPRSYGSFTSPSQKLDALLDELEIEYDLKRNRGDKEIKGKGGKIEDDDLEMDLEEIKLWKMASAIKKHNFAYRTTNRLLKDLQKQQRMSKDTGLLPASTTVSATSCSSLEPEDLSHPPRVAQECPNLIQKSPNQKSPFCITSTKRVTFCVPEAEVQKSNEPAQTPSPRKVATAIIEKPLAQPLPPPPPTFDMPTLASTAKMKSKSITGKDENFNPTSSQKSIPATGKSSSGIIAAFLQKNLQKQPPPPVTIVPSRIPTSVFSRQKLPAKEDPPPVIGPPPLPALILEKIKETTPLSTPVPKPMPAKSLMTIAKPKPKVEQKRPSTSPSAEKIVAVQSPQTKTVQLTTRQNQTQLEVPGKGINALGIIRGLLEHAQSAATTLFDIKEPDGLYGDEVSSASDATYTLDDNRNDVVVQKSQAAAKLRQDISEAKEREEFMKQVPKMQMIFGVPYVPGASKIPKASYLL